MKFEFIESFPEEFKPVLLETFKGLETFIPCWVQKVIVIWDAANDNSVMECRTYYNYRFLKITVCPHFFSKNNISERREIFIHEICHGFSGDYHNFALDAIDRLIPDSAQKEKEIIITELRDKWEAMTQDLAFMVSRNLDKNEMLGS